MYLRSSTVAEDSFKIVKKKINLELPKLGIRTGRLDFRNFEIP